MGNSRLIVSTDTLSAAPTTVSGKTQQSSQKEKTNPFLVASTPLLTLMTQVRACESSPDINKLHMQIISEVKLFVSKLKQLEFPQLLVDCSTYCLCAALDEAILSTPWGTQSQWVQSSLLSIFKGETWGGERFYIIAENLSREPRKNIYVLEFIYTLLSLGFEGRYFGESRMKRDQVRNHLFQKIRSSRGKIEKALSLHWQDNQSLNVRQHKINRLKQMIFLSAGALFFIGGYYNIAAYNAVKPVVKSLKLVSHESPITAYSLLLGRSIFPEKLH